MGAFPCAAWQRRRHAAAFLYPRMPKPSRLRDGQTLHVNAAMAMI